MSATKPQHRDVYQKICPRCGNNMTEQGDITGKTMICEIERCGYRIDMPHMGYVAPIKPADEVIR